MQDAQKTQQYPEDGELVMGVVSKVFPYGVFVKLNDYPGVEGMIHISEVSAKWVKNIRDYAEEGKTLVVKVLRVDHAKGHVDLSLKSVKENQKKLMIEENKQEHKALKFIELAGKKIGDEASAEKIAGMLEKACGSAYDALQKTKRESVAVLKQAGLDEKWVKSLGDIVEEHITIPKVSIKAVMELKAAGSDGVDIIKNTIAKAKAQCAGVDAEFKYIGAPRYSVQLTGLEYKTLEKCLEKITKTVTDEMSGKNNTVNVKKV